jgi:hypothetical protein
LKADNEADGIVIPTDVGSRVGDTGVLNSARDFVIDGLGSIAKKAISEPGSYPRRDRRYVPKDVWLDETKRLAKSKAQEVKAPKKLAKTKVKQSAVQNQESKSDPLDLALLARNSMPYPVKTALDSAIEAVQSANRVVIKETC